MRNGNEGLVKRMIAFAAFLKDRGFRIFQNSIHDALRALEVVGLENRADFFACLRANLTSTDLEWAQFKTFFDEFWMWEEDIPKEEETPLPGPDPDVRNEGEECPLEEENVAAAGDESANNREWLEGVAYTPVASAVEKKDLGRFDQADVQVANLALKKMMVPFELDKSRRLRKSRKSGGMDVQRIMRKSMKTGGIPFELFFKRKKSGSNDW